LRLGQNPVGWGCWKGILSAVALFSMLLGSQLLFAPAALSQSSTPGTVPLTQSIVLRGGYYRDYEVDSFSNSTQVRYGASSNVPISTALMTAAQYNDWQANATDPISNSITYYNGTYVQNSSTITPGQYFIVFYAYYGRSTVQFGYEVSPSTPYSYGGITPPLAMGVASFGVYNKSGTASTYQIETGEIAGLVNISSVQVYTPNAGGYGVSTTGFTVQLNAMLVVNDGATSSPKVYWVQNVPDFETGPSALSFGDEIWNNTDASGFLSNQTITSTNFQNGGFVYTTGATRFSSGISFYSYSMNNATYALPLRFGLLMTAALVSGTGVVVKVGYRTLANGSATSSATVWFDEVTIHDPSAQSAYFEVSGSQTPPMGLYYDAELVFAGEGNLESAYFTALDATLGLFYQNGNSQILSSFPSYYGFSGDTGESAANLVEAYSNGVVHLTPGSPTYPYLGNSTLSLDPNSFTVSGSTGTSTVTSTGPTTGTSTGSLTSTTVQSSTGAQLASPTEYVLVGVVVAVVVIVIAAALYRLRPKSPQPQETGFSPDLGGPPPPPPEPGPEPSGAG
jgi:thermopsin